jgi:hypothetical protein
VREEAAAAGGEHRFVKIEFAAGPLHGQHALHMFHRFPFSDC